MNSNSATVWGRLSDRTKLPRRLWYPPAPVDAYEPELWQKQFDDVSTTVRRSMFGIIAYAAFCLVTLGQPDAQMLRTAAVQLPIVNTSVSVAGFMVIGPLVLVGLTVYLHIFIGRWVIMKRGKTADSLSPPFIFNLPSKSAAVVSTFLFYWLPPIVLASFIYKGAPFTKFQSPIELGVVLVTNFRTPIQLGAVLVTMLLVLLAIRRCPDDQRKRRNPVLWLVLLVLFAGLEVPYSWEFQNWRPVNIEQADLSGENLRFANLAHAHGTAAYLIGTDLFGANLYQAFLPNADLHEADLRKTNLELAYLVEADLHNADLREANLRSAILMGANLAEADLLNADLREANLFLVDLRGANLAKADLRAADLRSAIGLNCAQLTVGDNWSFAFRDDDVACNEPIPKPLAEPNSNE